MKKIFTIIMVATMLFALVACGNSENTNPSTPESSGNNTEATDISGYLNGIGTSTAIYSNMTADQKQALIAEAAKDGVEVTFNTDGSTVIKEPDGSTMTQHADGTWTIKDADGNEVTFGADWPDNEFTKLIPKPDFAVAMAGVSGGVFAVAFSDVTLDQLKAYVEKVKSAGFTVNSDVTDMEYAGMVVYSYVASNFSGYIVNIYSSAGSCGMSITKG